MLAHVDEVEGRRNEKGPMAATWQRLGDAAGAKGIGVNRVRVEPGRLPTPPHSHGASEEIYYVLGGSGLLWQDEAVCEVRAGDIIVQVADHHEHTFKGGPDGLDYLVFGTRHPVEYGWLPRSNARAVELAVGRGTHGRPLGHRGSRSASSSSPSRASGRPTSSPSRTCRRTWTATGCWARREAPSAPG